MSILPTLVKFSETIQGNIVCVSVNDLAAMTVTSSALVNRYFRAHLPRSRGRKKKSDGDKSGEYDACS
jgi:hypothetical protein